MNFDELFDAAETGRVLHPAVERWQSWKERPEVERALLTLERPRVIPFHEEATLHVRFLGHDGEVIRRDSEPWDADLNADTVRVGLRGADRSAEVLRFAMALSVSLSHAEERYGDGYFNAILVGLARELNTNKKGPLARVLKHLPESRPYDDGRGTAEACREVILSKLKAALHALHHDLGYKKSDSRAIFLEALAQYLDERFSVSLGRALGLR